MTQPITGFDGAHTQPWCNTRLTAPTPLLHIYRASRHTLLPNYCGRFSLWPHTRRTVTEYGLQIERQHSLHPLIEKACRKVSAAALRKFMVQLHSYFILVLKQMWALKSLLPMHEQIAMRLSTDMSSFVRLYHIKDYRRKKFAPPTRPPRNPVCPSPCDAKPAPPTNSGAVAHAAT